MTLYSSDFATSGSGSSILKIQNMTADGIVSDWNYLVPADASALTSNLVVTLPSSTANSIGKSLSIKKTDNSNNAICIKPNESDTINNSTNFIYLFNKDDCITITSIDNGKCTTSTDNRNSTGNTASFLRVTKPTGQTTNLTSDSTILFDTVEVLQGNGISFNTTTGVFTLSPNKTFKLTACFPKINLSSGGYCYTKWYNDTTSKNIGSGSGGDATTSTSSTIPGCITTCTITPTVTTNLRCIVSGSSSVTGIGDSGNIIWAEVEEKSKQATVINSVDYIQVSRISSDQQTLGKDSDLIFNSKSSGNIPYNVSTGIFTLTAGKTFDLCCDPFFNIFSDTNGGYLCYEWVDATTNSPLFANGSGVGTTTSLNRATNEFPVISASIKGYTPTTNQTVKVRVTGGVGTANLRSAVGSRASIIQIGSSAVSSISGNYINAPWQNYTPVIGVESGTAPSVVGVTIKAMYKVIGKSLFIKFRRYGASSGAGSGNYTISLPNSYVIDTSLAEICTTTSGTGINNTHVGYGTIMGNQGGNIRAFVASSTSVKIHGWIPGVGTSFWGSTFMSMADGSYCIYCDMEIPIL